MPNQADLLRGVQGLAAVESTDLGAALSSAESIARGLVAEEFWSHDIFTAAPSGARWKSDELIEQLLYQQAYQPQGDVRVLIITYAHLMDPRLHDQLLKVVEEPVAPILFLFVVAKAESLPTTIQSRIYRTISIPPRSAAQLTAEISAASGSKPSEGVLELAQQAPTTAAALTGDSADKVLQNAELYLQELSGSGFTAGWAATKALKELSRAVSGGAAEAPKTKAAQREALRAGLEILKESCVRDLATGTVEQAQEADNRLARLERAGWLSDAHLPIDQVLVYATTGGSNAV